jgi:hypothetical protein
MSTKVKETKEINRLKGNGSAVEAQSRVSITAKTVTLAEITVENLPATDYSSPSLLGVNRFSEKNRRQMREKQMGIKASGKQPKDPIECMKDSLYRFSEEVRGTIFGVPAVAIKQATVRAFKAMDGYSMVDAKGFFHVYGKMDEEEVTELVPVIAPPVTALNYKEKLLAGVMNLSEDEMLELLDTEHRYGAHLREDDVRVGQGTADIRYRGAFSTWEIPFTVAYDATAVKLSVLCEAIDRAGRSVGICENRPEKSGDRWGTFQIKN